MKGSSFIFHQTTQAEADTYHPFNPFSLILTSYYPKRYTCPLWTVLLYSHKPQAHMYISSINTFLIAVSCEEKAFHVSLSFKVLSQVILGTSPNYRRFKIYFPCIYVSPVPMLGASGLTRFSTVTPQSVKSGQFCLVLANLGPEPNPRQRLYFHFLFKHKVICLLWKGFSHR